MKKVGESYYYLGELFVITEMNEEYVELQNSNKTKRFYFKETIIDATTYLPVTIDDINNSLVEVTPIIMIIADKILKARENLEIVNLKYFNDVFDMSRSFLRINILWEEAVSYIRENPCDVTKYAECDFRLSEFITEIKDICNNNIDKIKRVSDILNLGITIKGLDVQRMYANQKLDLTSYYI